MHVKSCFDGIRTHASQLLVGHYYQLGYVVTYWERGKLSPLFIPLKNRIGLDLIRARQGTNMVAKFTVACWTGLTWCIF